MCRSFGPMTRALAGLQRAFLRPFRGALYFLDICRPGSAVWRALGSRRAGDGIRTKKMGWRLLEMGLTPGGTSLGTVPRFNTQTCLASC